MAFFVSSEFGGYMEFEGTAYFFHCRSQVVDLCARYGIPLPPEGHQKNLPQTSTFGMFEVLPVFRDIVVPTLRLITEHPALAATVDLKLIDRVPPGPDHARMTEALARAAREYRGAITLPDDQIACLGWRDGEHDHIEFVYSQRQLAEAFDRIPVLSTARREDTVRDVAGYLPLFTRQYKSSTMTGTMAGILNVYMSQELLLQRLLGLP